MTALFQINSADNADRQRSIAHFINLTNTVGGKAVSDGVLSDPAVRLQTDEPVFTVRTKPHAAGAVLHDAADPGTV